jgi:Ca2+-binding EF-hand superfamily protein
MSHKPTDQQLEDAINAVFGKYDVDKSDSLDFGEVKNLITDAFSKLNQPRQVTEEDVKKFAMAVDKNSDGKITRVELFAIFKQIIEKKHAGH